MTFPYAHLNKDAHIWIRIICHCLILGKHMIDVTRDRVFLIYALMRDNIEINTGIMILSAMKAAHYHQGCRYGFSGLLTRFLRDQAVNEEDYITDNSEHDPDRCNQNYRFRYGSWAGTYYA